MKTLFSILLLLVLMPSVTTAQQVSSTIYRNRIGGIILPYGSGLEYERFLTRKQILSLGATTGMYWRTPALKNEAGEYESNIYAFNPYMRLYFWRPANWLSLGWDVKPSFVWLDVEKDFEGITFFTAIESHLSATVQYRRVYMQLGFGAKHFFQEKEVPAGDGFVVFPENRNLPAGEFIVGFQF